MSQELAMKLVAHMKEHNIDAVEVQGHWYFLEDVEEIAAGH